MQNPGQLSVQINSDPTDPANVSFSQEQSLNKLGKRLGDRRKTAEAV
jgi:hypothetical protein